MNLINKYKNSSKLLKYSLLLSILSFAISLTQTAFFIESDSNSSFSSIGLFLLGWTSFLAGGWIYFLIWLANPIYLSAIFSSITNRTNALFLSAIATTLAILFSRLEEMITSEMPSYSTITSLALGYKLWLGSFIILFVGNVLDLIALKKKSV